MEPASASSKEFPSLSFYSTSSYRIVPVIITFLVIVIMASLAYLVIYISLRRKVSCNNPPSTPQNVIAGYVNRRTFGVSWDRVGSADSYVIFIGEFPDFTREQALAQFETDQTLFNVEDLEAGETYYIRVAARNSCGLSEDSVGITYIFLES